MVTSLLSALALVLVLEGLMPFGFPERWKRVMRKTAEQDEKVLRIIGFFSMAVGIILLTVVRQFTE